MKKKSSIVKLSIVGVLLIIGLILSFVPMDFGFTSFSSFSRGIKLGLDLKGGIYAVYEADSTVDNFESRMEGTRESLLSLLQDKGYTEATVSREGNNRLRVEVPDVDNPQSILQIVGEPASIRFVLDSTGEDVLTGDDIVSAIATYYEVNKPVVSLSLNSAGAKRFAEATSNNIGQTMSIRITVGGEERTISSPSIESAITNGKAIITNMESFEAAENLANQIMSGTFGVTLNIKETSTISADLGDSALKWGLIAGLIGLALVMAFMIYTYRLFGVIASVSLVAYSVLMLFFLSVFPLVQLTLPGIAGILLSIGMAVDGNVVIYERIKDEYRNGKSIRSSMHYGFRRSRNAIIDGNVTTAIAAIMLIIFPTGTIKGFAITLLIGLVFAVINSLIISWFLTKWVVALNDKNPNLYNLKRGKNYIGLSADQTDSAIQREIDAELERKAREAKEQKERKENGGLNNETV